MKITGDKLFIVWEDKVEDGITAVCEYDAVTGHYLVTVNDDRYLLSESFLRSSRQDLSMSTLDAKKSVEIADKLIEKLKKMYIS